MASDPVAVVDVGSTTVRYGRVSEANLVDVDTEPTRPRDLPAQLVGVVRRLRERADGGGNLSRVAISTTGLVDHERGVVTEFDTADGDTLHDIPLAEVIEAELGLPTTVENDCTAAALGEAIFGDGRGYGTVVHVTVGTGIGAGVVVDGEPLRGERGYAAEVGLIPVVADGDLASTGVRGAWEAYCGGRGIPRFAERLLADADDGRESVLRAGDELTAPDVFTAAADGDAVARDCLDRVARYNAAGVGAVLNAFDPGIVTVGGSVARNNPEWFFGGLDRYLGDYALADPPEVRLTGLGADIELYGAAAAAGYTL
ncbi:glucokinase [Halogranum gelatinilyticum]|uniref:Glucokinase n=1 Tax=Halogranum gelatinilyticum TaxID=660521 RepID=A0A1G9XCL2_9EURY|nr:ROK family protein [Halogranum gelatinilyticum]SDM94427.1 glucokinase [Halogranum gelatinilyticum]